MDNYSPLKLLIKKWAFIILWFRAKSLGRLTSKEKSLGVARASHMWVRSSQWKMSGVLEGRVEVMRKEEGQGSSQCC